LIELAQFWKWYLISRKRIKSDCTNDMIDSVGKGREKLEEEIKNRKLTTIERLTATLLNLFIKFGTFLMAVMIMMSYNLGLTVFIPVCFGIFNLLFGLWQDGVAIRIIKENSGAVLQTEPDEDKAVTT